ncbi:MAG: hypothetical protein MK101_07195 [Phycisphaerales bacterium]|nr:hypothetical protein [Phycisphaerales bacterium]
MSSASRWLMLITCACVACATNADVVIDMPPPPQPSVASEAQEATAADARKQEVAPRVPAALVRFADRAQAQDSAGNPRGVDVPSVWTSSTSVSLGDFSPYGGDWYDQYNWGWPGIWAIQPLYWGGGWGGGWACPPRGPWGGGWSGGWAGNGVSLQVGGARGCFSGAAAVNLRLGNWGW